MSRHQGRWTGKADLSEKCVAESTGGHISLGGAMQRGSGVCGQDLLIAREPQAAAQHPRELWHLRMV